MHSTADKADIKLAPVERLDTLIKHSANKRGLSVPKLYSERSEYPKIPPEFALQKYFYIRELLSCGAHATAPQKSGILIFHRVGLQVAGSFVTNNVFSVFIQAKATKSNPPRGPQPTSGSLRNCPENGELIGRLLDKFLVPCMLLACISLL